MCSICQNGSEPDTSDDDRESVKNNARYLNAAFGPMQYIVDDLRRRVDVDSFDTLVGTGLSGALVIPRLADILGKKWAIVRKADNSHSNKLIEGEIGRRWLFLDDTVVTGDTRKRVIEAVRRTVRLWDFSTEFVGSYLYHDKSFQNARQAN